MPTPNQMPAKANPLHQQLLAGLIATKPVSWVKKTLGKDADGKETVESTKVTHEGLRFPLAQNVSDFNVNVLARRWVA